MRQTSRTIGLFVSAEKPYYSKALCWSLLVLIALLLALTPASVSASPGVILEPSFETVDNWTYSTTSFFDGAQSMTWKTSGSYSYLLSTAGNKNIASGKYCQILQSVNFDTLDTISFDADLYAASDGFYEARVIVGTTTEWFKACSITEIEYLHQEIDVSGYTGPLNLIFQVVTIAGANNIAMNAYFDNIKTWGSFNDAAHTTVDNYFDVDEYTVYMHGENFDASTAYHVAYYDSVGTKIQSEGDNSTSGGTLISQCYFPNYQESATPGIWHVVVYKDSIASPPETYTPDDPNRTVEDSFEVTAAAIPEFPTLMAVITVTVICFGIYYWVRRRKLAYVKA